MEGMRDLLRSSLGRSLRTLTPLDRLATAWPVVCGPVLAARGELLAFADGRLTVRVDDPAWREQLRSAADRLRRELARVAAVELREIHFEGSASERPRRVARASGPRSGTEPVRSKGSARPPGRVRKPSSRSTRPPAETP